MMPSHRREQAGPALQVLPFACSKPSSLVDLYHQSHPHHRSSATLGSFLSSPLDSMESWFPVSTGMDHTRDCRSAILNAQHHDTVTNNNIADFHLTELQTQQWWPTSIASQGRQQQSDGRESDLKLDSRGRDASNVTFVQEVEKEQQQQQQEHQHGFDIPAWSQQQQSSNKATTDRDLNAPAMAMATSSPSAHADQPPATTATTTGQGKTKDQRKRISISAPATPTDHWGASPKEKKNHINQNHLGVQKKGGSTTGGKRPISQRESHIWSERQRRKGMNHLFMTLRSLLPHPTSKTDKSTVVLEIIKYIQSLEVDLEVLKKKRHQMHSSSSLAASRSTFSTAFRTGNNNSLQDHQLPISCHGLTVVDNTSSNASAMTAVAALPPPGSESCLQSYLGANVGLHVCGLNVFVTISSPRGQRGLFDRILVTVHNHQLEVINANISTSNTSIFHCLHCQGFFVRAIDAIRNQGGCYGDEASQGADFLQDALHTALQSVISNFDSSA